MQDTVSLKLLKQSSAYPIIHKNMLTEKIQICRSPKTTSFHHANPAFALMIVGTASDVGKSAITAGICRLILRRGIRVAPFKSQNMALNAAVTPEGGEIGRAQAAQAAACRITPHTDMNPVLLKPTTDTGSQVIVHGKPVGLMSVREYDEYKPEAIEKIKESYLRLKQAFDFIVIEGAGSIAEINLKDRDIANLAVARMAGNAPAILVADIDRGGVFAQIIGTFELLQEWERPLVKGIIINKFRGDPSILASGLDYIESRCGIPVLGVMPFIKNLELPAEDSVNLPPPDNGERPADKICVGILRLPRISNFTDFEPLRLEADLKVCYIEKPEQIHGLDMLIIPGTKATAPDLQWLRGQNLDRAIMGFGGLVIGICGGFQMLGDRIEDPYGIESDKSHVKGLALLPVVTTLSRQKTTRLVTAAPAKGSMKIAPDWSLPVSGYEIHSGQSAVSEDLEPFAKLWSATEEKQWDDGAVSSNGKVAGTYLHGLFDDICLRESILNHLRRAKKLPVQKGAPPAPDPYDSIADTIEMHLDMERLWNICGIS